MATVPILPFPPPDAPPPPEANGDPVAERRLVRWWHGFLALFRPSWRERTALEVRLQAEVDGLRYALWERDCTLYRLRREKADLEGERLGLQRELSHWVAIHERDRLRVEADRAVYAGIVAREAPRDGNARRPEEYLD